MSTSRRIKCVITGDEMSGKKCLIGRIVDKPFEAIICRNDVYETEIVTEAKGCSNIKLQLHYVNAAEEFKRIRPIWYNIADVIIHCRSEVNNTTGLDEWSSDFRQYCRNVPIILVATKVDLRDKTTLGQDRKQKKLVKKLLGSSAYVECSALTGEGFDKVIELIVTSTKRGNRERRKCSIS